MINKKFEPKEITVESGTMIIWYNTTNKIHNAYPLYKRFLKKNKAGGLIITKPGTYDYYCVPHRTIGMTGKIIVSKKKKKKIFKIRKPISPPTIRHIQ